jgi:hypothetical protein
MREIGWTKNSSGNLNKKYENKFEKRTKPKYLCGYYDVNEN